jgi:excinuclease ABC subunit A
LAESIESALVLSEGLVQVVSFDEGEAIDILFSELFSCMQCNYSLEELEPRLFSFNNPNGACSECDGLGVSQYFDPDRIVTSWDLSLSNGAVRGWDRKNGYYYQMLLALSDHYKFDLNTPLNKLPKKIVDVVLYGSGEEEISFSYASDKIEFSRLHVFEGIINNMKRRYKETESNMVREELNKYISIRKCDVCEGERLNEAARNVFVNDKSLPYINQLSIADSYQYFIDLKLPGKKGEIADKIVKEIRERLEFLVNVGLNYLSLERKADSLSGGDAQRIR